jgi:hypothetical protein
MNATLLPIDEVILEVLREAREPLDCAEIAHRGKLWLQTTPVERSASLHRLTRCGLVRRVCSPQRDWVFPLFEGTPRVSYQAADGREAYHGV